MDGSNYVLASYQFSATNNNGQITSATNGRLGYSITYQYDLLKRLTSASAGSHWTQTFGYDGFGNLTSKSIPSGSSETAMPAVNPANNQFTGTGYSYGPKGNLLGLNNFSFIYDPESRMSSATTGSSVESYNCD